MGGKNKKDKNREKERGRIKNGGNDYKRWKGRKGK